MKQRIISIFLLFSLAFTLIGCGKSDTWTCPECNKEATGNFCSNCGASRNTEPESAESHTDANASETTEQEIISDDKESNSVNVLESSEKEEIKASPDKYTFYISDYVGLNFASIGYTSLGGNRIEKYGEGHLKLIPVTIDGTYIDLDDEDDICQYMVVGQSIAPNTELKLTFKKNEEGEEYDNLIDYQNIDSIDLVLARVDGNDSGKTFQFDTVAINPTKDRYTTYIRNYVGKNLYYAGYTSLGGDLRDEYLEAYPKLCPVTADGTYIDVEDRDLLQEYVIVGQSIAPNTELLLTYKIDDDGKENINSVEMYSIAQIDLQVERIDGETYNDEVTYEPISINPVPDKYTDYIRNYVGKNLASCGYTSWSGKRMDQYGESYMQLVLITPNGASIDLEDQDELSKYCVVSQDIAPNTKISITYKKDDAGNDNFNSVESVNYSKITLTLKEINPIPDAVPVGLKAAEGLPVTEAAPVSTHFDGTVQSYRDFDYIVQNDGTAVIVAYKGNDDSVTIPSDFDGHEVTGIGPSAFENHTELKSISMWADPTFISERAFMGCSKLREIQISSTCESIGASAFEGCYKLSSVTIWGAPSIGARAFFGCLNIKEISIDSEIKNIGESAFECCSSLKSVLIWGGTNIESRAFAGCVSLKEISIDRDTEYVGDYAFYGCTKLSEVTIWGENTKIGNEAFGNCPALKEINRW